MPIDKESSSYSAFASVDDLASKPVLGSDGAASWQDFRNNSKKVISRGVAPSAPIKKADRLGTGFSTIEEERKHEEKVRRDGGAAEMHSGYTTFKRKQDRAEIEERKRRKLIESRTRPDKVKYFIKADAFEGWKMDYIFTTRDRGTGYYWDGMDSLKKLRGEDVSYMADANKASSNNDCETHSRKDGNEKESKTKKKKKKKKKDIKDQALDVIADDPNNPMQQVLDAMRRRTEVLSQPPGSKTENNSSLISLETKAALTGSMTMSTIQNIESSIKNERQKAELAKYSWEVATDPSSGKTYYFSRVTGERQWDNPLDNLNSKESDLPNGWQSALDAAGRTYYYHRESGKTSWEKPTNIVINGLT